VPHDIFFSGGEGEAGNITDDIDEAAETIKSRRTKKRKGKKKKVRDSFLGGDTLKTDNDE
jgi:hypothetical protein